MKKLLVYVGEDPSYYLEVTKDTNIGNLKRFLRSEKNYNIHMFVNPKTELKIFHTDKYDGRNLESIFDKIENGSMLLTLQKFGKIRIAQQARARSYPVFENFEVIPAWSRGAGEWKQLSPFYLKFGDGIIFENFWQSFKVWETVEKQKSKNWTWPSEKHVAEKRIDEDENPNEKWYKWHEALLHHDKPVRRPNGKAVPLYAYWEGEKLNTIEGRKQIYIPYLQQLYRAHPVYMKLLEKVKSGKNIMLVEPDGPYLEAYPNGLEVNLPLLKELIERMNYADEGYPNKYRPYGHGYVLAMTILEDLEQTVEK